MPTRSIRTRRDAGQAWIERTNPLRGLSIREAQMIFDAARGGDTQRLHWIFQEVERANATLMTCVERRTSALAMLPWSATVRANADETLADEQKDAIERLISGIDNFDEAVEHLDLAFFRGFAYAQPLIEPDGTVRHVELIPSWTFLSKDGRLYYNPACDGFSSTAEEVTAEAGLVGIRRTRAVDYPALAVHIREAVGERDWGRFLERIALPKPAVTMAPAATEDDKALYVEAAERVEDGLVSVWPNGAALTDFMGGSRGQDPFSAFVRHQEERIVRMATGGTLGSIAEAGSGTLAGGAQADVWREIVGRDAVIVGAAIMRSLVRPYLERAFPGVPSPPSSRSTPRNGSRRRSARRSPRRSTRPAGAWTAPSWRRRRDLAWRRTPGRPLRAVLGRSLAPPAAPPARLACKPRCKALQNARRHLDGRRGVKLTARRKGRF